MAMVPEFDGSDKTTTQIVRGKRALAEHRAKTQPRFHLKFGDAFLHFSGSCLCNDKANAWIGSASQVENIKRAISLASGCKSVGA